MHKGNTRFGRRKNEAVNKRPAATSRCNQKFHRPRPQLYGAGIIFMIATVISDDATSYKSETTSKGEKSNPWPISEHGTFAHNFYSNARSKCSTTRANHNATGPYIGKKNGDNTATSLPKTHNYAHCILPPSRNTQSKVATPFSGPPFCNKRPKPAN